MRKPFISMIAAIGRNRELGKDNKLLWRIPEDMKRFRQLTSGHVVIMGRKTYQSIGRPLPNRTNIVITHDPNLQVPGCLVVMSVEDALVRARELESEEIFVIGGGQIYDLVMPHADKLYLTLVDAESEADAFFPDYSGFQHLEKVGSGKADGLSYQFLELTHNSSTL